MTSPQWSLILGPEPAEAKLHNLHTDAHQEHNCILEHVDVAKRLHKALVDFMRERGADEGYIEAYARL